MAITIDWGTKVINIPRADMQLVQSVPNEVRQLDIDDFRLTLNDLQDDAVGMTYPTTHTHVQPVTVGGVTLARVVEIINGYTLTFEDGIYAVNLVGANSNLADVTNLNSVSLRTANSAGLTFSEQINQQSFIGATVFLNVSNGLEGTLFPRGTPTDPVNNISDAVIICNNLGFRTIELVGFIAPTVTENISYIKIIGGSGASNVILLSGTDTTESEFNRVIVAGQQSGLASFQNAIVGASGLGGLTNAEGRIVSCIINSTAGVIQNAAGAGCLFDNCAFITPDMEQVTVNANGKALGFRFCTGRILLTNYTTTETSEVNISGAEIVVDSSCTSGTILVTGYGTLIDNSAGGCTVVDNTTAAGSVTDQDKADIANRIIPQIWAAS